MGERRCGPGAMRLIGPGGCGAWPAAGQACSGYLVEHDGFRLLIDPGYAILPRLLELIGADLIDSVLISHGHPDHCADLHPLLRARALRDSPPPPLVVHTLPKAVDQVLALDRPGMLEDAFVLQAFAPGDRFQNGPFRVETCLVPHSVFSLAFSLAPEAPTRPYPGDPGPRPALADPCLTAELI